MDEYDLYDIERDYDKDEIYDDYEMTEKDNFENYDSWKTNLR